MDAREMREGDALMADEERFMVDRPIRLRDATEALRNLREETLTGAIVEPRMTRAERTAEYRWHGGLTSYEQPG